MKKKTSWDRLENFLTTHGSQVQPTHVTTSLPTIQLRSLTLTVHRDLLSAHRLSMDSLRLLVEERICL